jgi:hypothetical protein
MGNPSLGSRRHAAGDWTWGKGLAGRLFWTPRIDAWGHPPMPVFSLRTPDDVSIGGLEILTSRDHYEPCFPRKTP